MLIRYLVTYDITDENRLRKVYKTMRGYGDHIQYSVFICDLSDKEKIELITVLSDLINNKEDQILIVDLGPSERHGKKCIETIGKAFTNPERYVIVV